MDQESESFQILAVDKVRKSKNRARPQHISAKSLIFIFLTLFMARIEKKTDS